MKMKQSVPKRRYIKFRRRGITQKKAYSTIHLDSSNADERIVIPSLLPPFSAIPELLTLLKLDKSGIKLPLNFQGCILTSTSRAAVRLEWLLASSIATKFNNTV